MKQNPNMMSNLYFMSKVLNINLININEKIVKERLLNSVNKKTYDKYKFNYLTSKKVLNKINFEILKIFLKNEIKNNY